MEARMKNPAFVLDLNPTIQAIMQPIFQSGISPEVLELVGLRVGQINACELCAGESFTRAKSNPKLLEKLEEVLDWKKSSIFSPAEQSALELTEAITELEHKYNSVSDELWSKIEKHYNEKEKAALIMFISVMNMFTRLNVSTRQMTAEW